MAMKQREVGITSAAVHASLLILHVAAMCDAAILEQPLSRMNLALLRL